LIVKTKAAVLYEMGKPTPYAQSNALVIEELDLEGPGTGEVLVELVGAGLCHSDLSVVDGSRPRVMPMVLGHEASGIVREVGENVYNLKPGDHVVFSFVPMCGHCPHCATGRPALCDPGTEANWAGRLLSGERRFRNGGDVINHHLGVSGFSQYTVAVQESLIKIDPALPLQKAALFGCAILTGVGAVVNTAKVEAGMSAAIFGLGGVGLSMVMGAHAAGAYPIVAVDLLNDKLQAALDLGATHTVNAKETDAVEAVREITGGGARYVFEGVGSAAVLAQAYHATARGGLTVTAGLPAPDQNLSIPAVHLVSEERTIKGSFMGSCVPSRDIPRFMAMYQAGRLPVDRLLTRTITLDEINAGFDALAAGQAIRQIIDFGRIRDD
jgi:Zn-dependent alcohol dehydrogenase